MKTRALQILADVLPAGCTLPTTVVRDLRHKVCYYLLSRFNLHFNDIAASEPTLNNTTFPFVQLKGHL